MTERRDSTHVVNPPIEEAEEIVYDRSRMGPGSIVIEVEFDDGEIDRLRAGVPRGPEGITRFIKRAALELADREAERKAEERLRASA